MVPVYFAPMEGVTDAVFRRVHHMCFSGVEGYYIPFISPTKHLVLTGREKQNVLPEYNAGVPCIPQVLTCDAAHFLWAARLMAELGYTEINLNAGCPSATVIAKGKGSGMLRSAKELDAFLGHVCARSPLPVSVKTRIGFDSAEEWAALLAVYARYPLKRLIVHPRRRYERYDPGTIHGECWAEACAGYPGELVYNGELFRASEVEALMKSGRGNGVMLGRGLVANPALARQLNGGEALRKGELIRFHDLLAEEMQAAYKPEIAFMKLRVVMKHMACCFADADAHQMQIRCTRSMSELLATDKALFSDCELKDVPAFVPDA